MPEDFDPGSEGFDAMLDGSLTDTDAPHHDDDEDDELEHLRTRPVGRPQILEDIPGPPTDEPAELAEGEAHEPTAEDSDPDAMPEDFDPGDQSDDLLLDDHLHEDEDHDDDDQGDDVALAA
jgi:hypothetical protein